LGQLVPAANGLTMGNEAEKPDHGKQVRKKDATSECSVLILMKIADHQEI
jgi:hypothetical protein